MSFPVNIAPLDENALPLAALFGLSGDVLGRAEHDFFRDANPLGFILFARNIQNPQQVLSLTRSLKDCLGRDVPILIDQEGGRVSRMRAPHWPEFPAPKFFGDADDVNGAFQSNAALAAMLHQAGINVNCTPVVDILFDDTHAAIGDRAFSSDPEAVGRLAVAVIRAHLEQGIIPVVKHMPGQGRANMDSHAELPMVSADRVALEEKDFVPYRHILKQNFAQAVWGMVSHIVYTAIDPNNPATCSERVTDGVIRRDMGFDGFLLSDDIVMGALQSVGGMGMRAARSIRAGCDAVLHCNGILEEMVDVAGAAPRLSVAGCRRFNASLVPVTV